MDILCIGPFQFIVQGMTDIETNILSFQFVPSKHQEKFLVQCGA